MWRIRGALLPGLLATCTALAAADGAAAQARGKQERGQAGPSVTLSVEARTQVQQFYRGLEVRNARPLPPGMRNRLAKGKPLPPGIAKQVAPDDLMGRLGLPRGFELLEVGVDVLLVEVATGVIHDVLMDVIR